jgi:F0F1-type ATP synthase delta subunit
MDWQATIVRTLIDSGTRGRRQSELIAKVGKKAGDQEVIAFLHLLAQEKKAQMYVLPGQVKQWRATKEIEKL